MEVSAEPAEPAMAVAAVPQPRIVTEDDDEMTFTDAWDDADEWPSQFGAAGLGIP